MKKFSSKDVIIGCLIAALIILVLLFIFMRPSGNTDIDNNPNNPNIENVDNKQGIEIDENAEKGGITHKSQEEIQAELNEKVAQGMINISMNTNPVFEDGTSEGNLLIVNSEKNNYPQVVYIVLKEEPQTEIYRSKAIPVGSKIENAALDVDLDPGVYECVAYFNNVDIETGSYLGTAGAEIVVTVKS